MVADWQVERSARTCAATGRALEAGETYYSALKETDEGFARYDYAPEAWEAQDPGAFFSFWRTRVREPGEEKERRLVIDTEAFYTFFASLEEPEGERQEVFRYLVALILTRKRVLRLDEIEKAPEGESLLLHDRRADRAVRVFCPPLADEQLAEAQENLNQIFECQIGAEDL